MSVVTWLAEYGAVFIAGSTVILGCGSLVVLCSRAPVHRQRVAELAVLATLVWAAVAAIPMPRITAGDATLPPALSPASAADAAPVSPEALALAGPDADASGPRYVFAWPFIDTGGMAPRGGTTRGPAMVLDERPSDDE